MAYTLGQAAKATGITKTTIAEAIKKGRISATKNDLGRYQIDPAELHRVWPPAPSKPDDTRPWLSDAARLEYERQIGDLKAALAAMTATKEGLEREVSRLDDHLTDLRNRLSPPVAVPTPVVSTPNPAPNRGIFGLFRRKEAA